MKYPDVQHCSSDLVANMKHSLRLRSILLVLLLVVAVGTILCCRAAVRRADLAGLSLQPSEKEEGATAIAFSPVNATLLRLASVDAGEQFLRKEVEKLVDGSFAGRDPLYRSFASWRRFHHHSEESRFQLERLTQSEPVARDIPSRLLRSPRDYQVLPELRRVARDWLRRWRFHPDAMSQLMDLVKLPLDLHNAGLRRDEDPSSSSAGDARARRYGSCAVVGNSGILLKNDHGELIDGHDLVIRLNNARTAGYERNVGSKTSLAFINSNILHLCARRDTCFCHPYGEHVPIVMYICQAAHFLDFTVCNASHKAPLLVTDPRFDLLCARIVKYYSLKRFVEETGNPPEEWNGAHDAKMFHYSSGMQAVVLALGICDRVSIFGFGKSAEAKHHYHTNQRAELSLHDYEAEYAFYRDLIERPQKRHQVQRTWCTGKEARRRGSSGEVSSEAWRQRGAVGGKVPAVTVTVDGYVRSCVGRSARARWADARGE